MLPPERPGGLPTANLKTWPASPGVMIPSHAAAFEHSRLLQDTHLDRQDPETRRFAMLERLPFYRAERGESGLLAWLTAFVAR